VSTAPPAWEQVARAIIESLSDGDISPELAQDWLRMILNYAETLES